MIYKRTRLSCLLWALFSGITGAMLAEYTILFWKNEIYAEVGYYTIGFGILAFALLIGCYLLINRVIFKQGEKFQMSKRAALVWESVIVFCICSAGLIYRIYLYLQSSRTIEATECFEIAVSDAGLKTEQILHGASSLYTFCLSVILPFFGKNTAIAVWLQIFIQMLTLLLAYFIVRKLAGKIAASVTMLMLAVSSVYINMIFDMTPECIFFMLYLIGMLIVGGFVKAYCTKQLGTVTIILGAVLSGIVIGALIYLDAVSLTLLILLPGLITGIRRVDSANKKYDKIEEESANKKSDKTEKNPTVGFSILVLGIILISAGLAMVGIFAIDAYVSGAVYGNVAKAWYLLYMEHLPIDYVLYQTEYSMIECYVQVILAAFLILSFWNSKKVQNAVSWMCMMLLFAPTPLARVGVLPYQVFSIFVWSALAGIGLQLSCFALEAESVEAEKEETGSVEAIAVQEEAGAMRAEIVPAKVDASEAATNSQAGKPRFIENPLPLPKKHERREMDFQYEVPEDKMKFDIDIKENDDFDI